MKDISFEKLDTIYFRKERMHSCIQQLLDSINGRSMPIKDLIFENGKLSKKRRDQLIDELMDCLLIYLNYRTGSKDAEKKMLDEKRMIALKSFFQCSLNILSYEQGSKLSDLLRLSCSVPIRKNFFDLLVYRFERKILLSSKTSHSDLHGNDYYTDYVRDLQRSSSRWTADFIDLFCFHHFPLDGWDDIGDIQYFQYLMDANDKQIDTMLNILKRNRIAVPSSWLVQYQNDKERYGWIKHPSYVNALRDDDILAFWNFMSLQDQLHSAEAFQNLIAGMIDVYTSLYCTNILSDSDRFYAVYDQLENIQILLEETGEVKLD